MLKNVTNVADQCASEMIKTNLISFFDLGFLNAGGYINIDFGQLNAAGKDISLLRKITDTRFAGKEVWQGAENWVYESGITSGTPMVTAVTINGTPVVDPEIDYTNGRVLLPTGATNVRARYSYKWVTFTSSQDSLSPLRIGDYSGKNKNQTPAEVVLPLPFVSFHVPPISKSKINGLNRNYDSKTITHNIVVEVFGQSASETQRISDIIANQSEHSMPMYCINSAGLADDLPLKFDGTLNSGKNHLELFEDYAWTYMKFKEITSNNGEYINTKVHKVMLKMTTQTILCGSGC
jgi:hypothetical protein